MSDRSNVLIYKVDAKFIFSPSQHRNEKRFVFGSEFLEAPISANNEELGEVSFQALRLSATQPYVPDANSAERERAWQVAIAGLAGFDRYEVFQRAALHVGLYQYEDGKIQLAPTIHEKGWFLVKNREVAEFYGLSSRELGAEVEAAFERSE